MSDPTMPRIGKASFPGIMISDLQAGSDGRVRAVEDEYLKGSAGLRTLPVCSSGASNLIVDFPVLAYAWRLLQQRPGYPLCRVTC
jgi:hypothetical protein